MNELTKLTSNLIKFRTTADNPEELTACSIYLDSYLQHGGLKTKIYNVNNKISIVAAKNIKKHYKYILNGHFDVVPATNEKAFTPFIKSNRLHGRGAMDMKSEVAAMCRAMLDLNDKKIDAALMLTSDEEIGGFNGVKYLVEKEKYICECLIVPDDGFYNQITLCEKGVLHVKISAKGKSAHGSRPWLGVNAIETLLEVFSKIKRKIPETTSQNRWKPTVNLGKFVGGNAANNVPDYAEMLLDFRYPYKKQRSIILSLIKNVVKKYKNANFGILVEGLPVTTNQTNLFVKKFIEVGKKHKTDFGFQYAHGASDARFFAPYDIPIIMFRPKASEAHVEDEWVDIVSLEKFYKILKDFLIE